MNRNVHQGHFGEAFIRVLGAAAGLTAAKQDLDVTGVDLMLCEPTDGGGVRYPSVEVQVKSWCDPRGTDSHWLYDGLTEVQFNRLAGGGFRIPRYLFVVIVPRESELYGLAGEGHLLLNHAAYWTSLAGFDPVAEPGDSRRRRVEIPKANLLTTQTLRRLLLDSAAEEGR